MVMARCELVKAICCSPTTGRVTVAEIGSSGLDLELVQRIGHRAP